MEASLSLCGAPVLLGSPYAHRRSSRRAVAPAPSGRARLNQYVHSSALSAASAPSHRDTIMSRELRERVSHTSLFDQALCTDSPCPFFFGSQTQRYSCSGLGRFQPASKLRIRVFPDSLEHGACEARRNSSEKTRTAARRCPTVLTARTLSRGSIRASRSKLERFGLSHASLANSLSVANAFRT